MKKNYFVIFITLFISQLIISQEVLQFSNYDGTGASVTANSSTVNDEITIVFEDLDIINNFYTDGRNYILLFGGLQLNGTDNFQGAPDFNDFASQPQLALSLSDSNVNQSPNTYSLTINLAQFYTGVTDGANVTGFNIVLQNEFGGGGNNQTEDLFIDLIDAPKNSTLPVEEFIKNSISVHLIDNKIQIEGLEFNQKFKLAVYDLNGRLVKKMNEKSVLNLDGLSTSVYILKLKTENNSIVSKKVIKK